MDKETAIKSLIAERKSYRAFTDQSITREQLGELLYAAHMAASCFNEQPWRFICATKQDEHYPRLFDCLNEWNRQWAGAAGALIITVAATHFAKNNKPNRFYMHDVGLATSQMSLRAVSMGLAVHPMAGFHSDKARQNFHIPDDFEPVTALAIGYPGDPDSLPEDMRSSETGPRDRQPLSDVWFGGDWQQSY